MRARRMFSADIVCGDDFVDMPSDSQLLYFHLGMQADDDGFVSPKRVMRMIGSAEDSLKILIAKKFIIPFESGVIVIRHWRANNTIRADRYQPTNYREEVKTLKVDTCTYHVLEHGNHEAPKRLPPGGTSKEVSKEVSKDVLQTKKIQNTHSNASMKKIGEFVRRGFKNEKVIG